MEISCRWTTKFISSVHRIFGSYYRPLRHYNAYHTQQTLNICDELKKINILTNALIRSSKVCLKPLTMTILSPLKKCIYAAALIGNKRGQTFSQVLSKPEPWKVWNAILEGNNRATAVVGLEMSVEASVASEPVKAYLRNSGRRPLDPIDQCESRIWRSKQRKSFVFLATVSSDMQR